MAGAWLGLLVATQIFIEVEMLTDTVIACLIVVAVLAASRPRAVLPSAWRGGGRLGVSAAAALLIAGTPCGHSSTARSPTRSPYLNA